jgi:DNA polymerase
MKNLSTLEWFAEAGVKDISGDAPVNFLSAKENQQPAASNQQPELMEKTAPFKAKPAGNSLAGAIEEARELADEAKTLADLRKSVEGFNSCGLKKTANKTVFADGNPKAAVMVIGEAPGADEDREGIPFCGMSGKLLDKVLFSINLTRKGDEKTGFYITNTLFWRPPGNRKPTPEELAICEPFLEKHIALVNPKILLLVGATAVQGVLKDNSAMAKLRGSVASYKNRYMQHDVPVMVTYHPSFLLRAPLNKRLAWEDMLKLQEKLAEIG